MRSWRIQLLERGIERNPDNWLLPLETPVGTAYLQPEATTQAAERYYAQSTAELPGAHRLTWLACGLT